MRDIRGVEDSEVAAAASARARSSARLAMEVSGMRCCFRACWAETRRSHSRAMAVARCGFEGGMCRRDFVAGLRTGREERWMVWWEGGVDVSIGG